MAFEHVQPSKRFVGYVFLFLATICGIYWMISSGLSIVRYKKYVIYFNHSITGLKGGSYVCYKGVPVGSVLSITLDFPISNRVKVVIEIKREVPIYKGCIAKIATQGLVSGVYCLDLANPDEGRELLEGPMPEIRSVISEVEEAIKNAPGVVVKISRLVDTLYSVVSSNKGDVQKGVHDAVNTISVVHDTLVELRKGTKIVNEEIFPNMVIALADLQKSINLIEGNLRVLTDGRFVNKMIRIVENIEEVSHSAHEATQVAPSDSMLKRIIG